MRSTTFDPGFTAPSAADETRAEKTAERAAPSKSALWTKLYTNLIEARQAQADAIVARHMALHDDKALKAIGWTETEIAALRRRAGISR